MDLNSCWQRLLFACKLTQQKCSYCSQGRLLSVLRSRFTANYYTKWRKFKHFWGSLCMLVFIIYIAHVRQNRATINPCTKQKRQCKMKTVDWLWTIVFRVRKQWDYCCHVLICMVKAAFSLTDVNYNISDQSPVLYPTFTLTRLSHPKISFKLLPCGANYCFSTYISF